MPSTIFARSSFLDNLQGCKYNNGTITEDHFHGTGETSAGLTSL